MCVGVGGRRIGDGSIKGSNPTTTLPSTPPRVPVFGLTSESYQPPWVVGGLGREEDAGIVGGVPDARWKAEEKVLAYKLCPGLDRPLPHMGMLHWL